MSEPKDFSAVTEQSPIGLQVDAIAEAFRRNGIVRGRVGHIELELGPLLAEAPAEKPEKVDTEAEKPHRDGLTTEEQELFYASSRI